MKAFTSLVLALAAATVSPTASATEERYGPWEKVSQSLHVTVMARTVRGSGVREIRVRGIIDAPASVLQRVADDIERYPQLIPYTTEAVIIAREDGARIAHERMEMPMMQAREYVVAITAATVQTSAGRAVHTVAWRSIPGHTDVVRDNAVRVLENEGSWRFEELDDGRTLATFTLHVDPAGALPSGMVNVAQELSMPKFLENLEQRARLPMYRG